MPPEHVFMGEEAYQINRRREIGAKEIICELKLTLCVNVCIQVPDRAIT